MKRSIATNAFIGGCDENTICHGDTEHTEKTRGRRVSRSGVFGHHVAAAPQGMPAARCKIASLSHTPRRQGNTMTEQARNAQINALTEKIIGCAIEVHRCLGPGLLESIYEGALCMELDRAGLRYGRQLSLPVVYKGVAMGDMRIDVMVEDVVILELKAVDRNDPLFKAQLLSYMRLSNKHVGLLINFNSAMLKDGVTRLVL
jgi:GxxExxY protein